MKRTLKCAVLSFTILLVACSAPASIGDTEAEVATFHRQLNAENYAAIWKVTSADLRNATTETAMKKLFAAVHRKLGKVVETKQVGWRSNVSTSGTFAEVQMDTKFEKGTGVESFVYRKDGDQLKLAGYHINSNDMVVN